MKALHELFGIVKIFILDGQFCKPEEPEVAWTQVWTIGWLRELCHLEALNFGGTISCHVNSGMIHVNPH
jgi:hypothetical protein